MSPSGNTVNAEGPGQVVFRSADQSQEGPFRGAGESLLEFQEELRLRPAPRERLVIELSGEVGCIHQDSAGALSTLTAETMRATVSGTSEGRDLSGIAAEGGVVVRTPTREVVAGRFDADLDGGLAEATAARPAPPLELPARAAKPRGRKRPCHFKPKKTCPSPSLTRQPISPGMVHHTQRHAAQTPIHPIRFQNRISPALPLAMTQSRFPRPSTPLSRSQQLSLRGRFAGA